MPNLDDVLRDKTFKGQTEDTARRVFYTLIDEEGKFQLHRGSKLISSLVELLEKKELLSEAEIDGLLLECVH